MDSQTKLKRVVIKEELVILTGDHIKALILNQLLYWSERTKDFDKFIQEERERFTPEDVDLKIDLTFGWIYKTADDLSKELMLGVSASTIRRHLSKLVKSGYIDQRHNPKHKWDRTLQYRPNIIAIQSDLEARGYAFEGYPLLQNAFSVLKNGTSKMENRSVENEGAIPETTTETTTETLQTAEKSTLNALADQMAAICQIDIDTASRHSRDQLKATTLSFSHKENINQKLKGFPAWWAINDWRGKRGEPPTPAQVGDTWGQYEAAKSEPANHASTLTDDQQEALEYYRSLEGKPLPEN